MLKDIFRLDSIRGRYLMIASLFIISVIAATWTAHIKVGAGSDQSLKHTLLRQELKQQLFHMENNLSSTEKSLLLYLLTPNPQQHQQTIDLLNQLSADFLSLSNHSIAQQRDNIKINLLSIETELAKLSTAIRQILSIRVDINQLYPANQLIDKMSGAHMAFTSSADIATEMLNNNTDQTQTILAYQLFSDVRYNWAKMIAAFRMYIANRFGVFGSPEAGMLAQGNNVDIYAESIAQSLKQLTELDDQELLSLELSDALQTMKQSYAIWMQNNQKAKSIYHSSSWRTDIPLFQNKIKKQLAHIWDSLHAMDKELDVFANDDVRDLTQTTNILSQAFGLIALILVIGTLLTFLAFEYSIRRPLSSIANAIKIETLEETSSPLPKTHMVETRDIVDSFDEMRERVLNRQRRLEAILDNAGEAIMTINVSGIIETFNVAAKNLFGYEAEECIGKNINMLLPGPHKEAHNQYIKQYMLTGKSNIIGNEREVQAVHKSGELIPVSLKVSDTKLPGKQIFTGIIFDMRERKKMLKHFKKMAEHDGLTDLYNRSYFQDELERVVEQVIRHPSHLHAVLYIDLDNFKYVNDTMSHAAGDHLLIEVASILRKRARKSDLIARFGGDEFTVLLFDTYEANAIHTADAFRRQIAEFSFFYGGKEIDIGCSIGIALVDNNTKSAEEVLSQADFACNLAKRQGRNRVYLFKTEDQQNVNSLSLDMGWSRRIKIALEKDHFALACQAIVNTRTRKLECYEVLIRMLDENNEIIMPGGFLPAAERFGLAADIDHWVIANAIDTLIEQRKNSPKLRYAINLSGMTLSNTNIYDVIQEKLKQTGLDPSALTFEVTETAAIADMNRAQIFLSQLQNLGCKTALDDFGSGMSSFAYLKDLPIDIVKIDGRFVKNLAENPVDRAMVKAMSEISQALNKQTVAEFVQDEKTMELLAQYGVDYGQGYYLGRPEMVTPYSASLGNMNTKKVGLG